MAAVGQSLGPYKLLERLGAGAMGEVWKARDERLGRLVALKTLPTARVVDDEQRTLILREARAAAAVPHPNVVTLYDVYSADGNDFLVMELVEGRNLSQLLAEDGARTSKQALDILFAITAALSAAHDRGILHRDVKAANVMLTHDGVVKVLDFGLAKLRESDLDAAGIGQGTRKPLVDADVAIDETAMPTVDLGEIDSLQATVEQSRRRIGKDHTSGLSDTMAAQPDPTASPTSEQREGTSTGPLGTVTGDFLGTPLYMSPEQVLGERPDAVSEVFAVGVLAYELLAGKPPYKARTLEDLFAEIQKHQFPPLPDDVPDELKAIVERATAFERDQRFQSMAEMAAALDDTRDALFGGKTQGRWVWLAAAVIAAVIAGFSVYVATRSDEATPLSPGDQYVERALQEYELFYQQKAGSSLKAALKIDANHPRAHAYMILMDTAGDDEAREIVRSAQRVLANLPADRKRDRALLGAAIALRTDGAAKAREVLATADVDPDREMAFWAAELAFRARDYDAARDAYAALLASDAKAFRGRIYDHYSAVLLYFDAADEAVGIGKLYMEAFPGEADALGVYATTLAAAGQLDQALRYAKEAVDLNASEDTFAGLAKVHAYRGELAKARELYATSMHMAQPSRRVLRRAALGLLHLADDQLDAAAAVLEPCLPGNDDGAIRERAACLWVAGLRWPERIPDILVELDGLAAAGTDVAPPYGFPAALAGLLRARQRFYGGGCILTAPADRPAPEAPDEVRRWLNAGRDFYASYHLPFFSTWSTCERATLELALGRAEEARAILEPSASAARPHILLLLAEIAGAIPELDRAEILTRAGAAWPHLDADCVFAKRLQAASATTP